MQRGHDNYMTLCSLRRQLSGGGAASSSPPPRPPRAHNAHAERASPRRAAARATLWGRLGPSPRTRRWSLTSLQQRLVKTGGRLVKHARYHWLRRAEGHLTRRLFGDSCGGSGRLPTEDILVKERSQGARYLENISGTRGSSLYHVHAACADAAWGAGKTCDRKICPCGEAFGV